MLTLMRDAHREAVDLPESALAVIERLSSLDDIETIIIYGSRALGDHDERSDIDVAIAGRTLDQATLARIRDEIDRSPTLYRISVADLATMPDPLRARVLSQGVTIYERAQA